MTGRKSRFLLLPAIFKPPNRAQKLVIHGEKKRSDLYNPENVTELNNAKPDEILSINQIENQQIYQKTSPIGHEIVIGLESITKYVEIRAPYITYTFVHRYRYTNIHRDRE